MELARKRYVKEKKDFLCDVPWIFCMCLGLRGISALHCSEELLNFHQIRVENEGEKESPETIDFSILAFLSQWFVRSLQSNRRFFMKRKKDFRQGLIHSLSLSINISWNRINWFWLNERPSAGLFCLLLNETLWSSNGATFSCVLSHSMLFSLTRSLISIDFNEEKLYFVRFMNVNKRTMETKNKTDFN